MFRRTVVLVLLVAPLGLTGATTALSSPPAASSSAAPALKANLYVRSVLADKPYAYWRLTDRAGRLAADVMRRATGTILGAVSRGEGPILDGGSFGFGRGHVRAKAPANFLPDTWSIEAWVKQDFQPRDWAIFSFSGGPQRPVKGSGAMLATAGGQQIYLAFQTRNHRIYLVTPATPPFFERLKRGVWHHFVGTRGRQTMRLYVDGVLLRSAKSSTDP